jgi:hypothetical protein
MEPSTSDRPPAAGDPALKPWMCGARRRDGRPCRKPGLRPSGRCRLHGGATPRGARSPHFKHGRYSRCVPAALAGRLAAARADPGLVSIRDGVALLRLRLDDLLGRLRGGSGGGPWAAARAAFRRLARALAAGRPAAGPLAALGALLEAGAGDDAVWKEILDVAERKSLVAQREWRRLRDLRMVMPADQAMTFVAAVVDAVRRHVPDPDARGRIMDDLDRLVEGDNSRP